MRNRHVGLMTALRQRRRWWLPPVFAALAASLTSCGLFGPNWQADPEQGRVLVLFTNTSDALVNVLMSASTRTRTDAEWLVAVAPHGWDTLVLDCDVEQLLPLGAIVTTSDPNGRTVPYTGRDLTRSEFRCGGVVVVSVTPNAGDEEQPVRLRMEVARRAGDAEFDPATDGFAIIELHGPRGVAADLDLSWEDGDARVYLTTLSLSGNETRFGFVELCPMARVAIGQLNDPNAPPGKVNGVELAGPAVVLEPSACSSIIRVQLLSDPNAPSGYRVALTEDATAAPELAQTFIDLRAILAAGDLASRPTNALQLVPDPAGGVPVAPP